MTHLHPRGFVMTDDEFEQSIRVRVQGSVSCHDSECAFLLGLLDKAREDTAKAYRRGAEEMRERIAVMAGNLEFACDDCVPQEEQARRVRAVGIEERS